jgi:hypothetical protein
MSFKTNEIYTIKVLSGEELITKVLEEDATTLTVSEPLSIAPNQQGMGLIPSMFSAEMDEMVKINKSGITMYAITAEQIRVKYIEVTTGISTPPAKKIILG